MQDIQRIDFTSATAAQDFTTSLHETGFAVLYNHPIMEKSIDDLYAQWQAFFLADLAVKEPYTVDPKTQYGWVPPALSEIAKGAAVKDIKEFYNYYAQGACPTELKISTEALYKQLLSIGTTLLTWLQLNTPEAISNNFSEPLPNMIADSPCHLFRINYYPALTGIEEEGAVRATEHTDIDLLTVLTAGSSGGLQAFEKDGQWHDIPCEQGNLVINIGDMLQECSQGYYPSTVHRVLNPTGEAAKVARMSCPMFIHPRDEVVLSEKYTGATYLHERLVELGLRKESET
jgi:isopenicillin N synthase-like dioxygenase